MIPGLSVRIAGLAVLLIAATFQNDAKAQPVSEREVTAEGLHRVDPSVLNNAWLRPDVDLSLYTHAFLMPTVVLFRELPPPAIGSLADTARDVFSVDDAMRGRLQETFGRSFHQAMEASPDFELADRLGRDVVLVRGLVTDVATGLPPDLPGSNIGAVRWIWEGNLVLELRDSMSNEVLLRIVERQRVDGPVEGERFWSLAPTITGQWSRYMVDQLSLVSDFFPSHLWRMQERARRSANQRAN